ncbi:MAG: TlpA family protein disulfide reductase [Pirellulales bacterium]
MRQHFYSSARYTCSILTLCAAALTLTGCENGESDNPKVPVPVVPNVENAPPAEETSSTDPVPTATGTTDGSITSTQVSTFAQGDGQIEPTTVDPAGPVANQLPVVPKVPTVFEVALSMKLETVPDGTPEELIKYMNNLLGIFQAPYPDDANQDELQGLAIHVFNNMLVASDKVLNQQSTSEFHRDAVQFKFMAYENLISFEPDKAEAIQAERMKIAEQLSNVQDPLVSIFARIFLFETMLIDFSQGNTELFQPVYEDAKAIVAAPQADQTNFGAVLNAANVFAQMGHSAEAIELANLLKTTFTKHENKELVERSARLDDLIIQYKIVGSMMATADGDDQSTILLENLQKLIDSRGKEDLEPLQMIQTVERQMEAYNKIDLAKKLSQMLLTNYQDHPNPQVAESVKISAEYAIRRLSLIGKPLPLTGKNLDGSPFNWEAYRGKYVLVDFWATWCTPCLEEIPNIERNLLQYRQAGFEVVGVNLDDSRQTLEQFLSNRILPWPTITSDDENAIGMDTPIAVHCGVDGIPFLVLVDPKGIVIEINPRGERLGEVLQSMLSVDAQDSANKLEDLKDKLSPPATKPAE